MVVRIITDDCMAALPTLEAGSVHMIGPTSPPYFSLRSYLPAGHPDKDREIGSEPTPEEFIEALVTVFREARRVLRDDGIFVLNLGDSMTGSGKGPTGKNGIGNQGKRQGFTDVKTATGLPAKNLLMIPFRAAIALQADGWILRSVIPWLKRNCMPESADDRPTNAIEYLFLFSKRARYFWDAEAIKQPSLQPVGEAKRTGATGRPQSIAMPGRSSGHSDNGTSTSILGSNQGAPTRSYRNSDLFFQSWQGLMCDDYGDPLALVVNPMPLHEAHFASFPPKLVEPFIKAGTRKGDTVLDLFGGAGTTGLVADRLGRDAILIELNPEYAEMARKRIDNDAGPLLSEPVTVEAPAQIDLFAGMAV